MLAKDSICPLSSFQLTLKDPQKYDSMELIDTPAIHSAGLVAFYFLAILSGKLGITIPSTVRPYLNCY